MSHRRAARRRLAALAAAVCAAILASAAPSAAAPPTPQQLTLRVVDLGRGYQRSDPECLSTELRGDGTSRVVDQLDRLPHRACEMSFLRAWTAPGPPAGPREVSSAAYAFAGPEGPQLALTRPRAVASFMFEPTREDFDVVEPAPALGEQAVVLQAGEAHTWSSTIVMWRSGAVLGVVQTIDRRADEASVQAALRLAVAQQARIAAPTPLRAEDNDDAEVALDDPTLDVPVFWLGRELPERGRLPSLSLLNSNSFSGIFARTGIRAALGYGRDFALTLLLSQPRLLHLRSFRRERRRIARDTCTRRERVAIPDGRATIWFRARGCERHPDDVFALARLDGVVVAIGVDVAHGPATRYATRAGMLRLLRALRPRPPAG